MNRKRKNVLEIRNLHISTGGKDILHGISLTLRAGEIHALMGPNGSGKSTLAYAVMGHPSYHVQQGTAQRRKGLDIRINRKSILQLPAEERARRGLFLAFQSPIAIPGVSVTNLLRTAYQEIYGNSSPRTKRVANPVFQRRWRLTTMSLAEFTEKLKVQAQKLSIGEAFLTRGIHDGFSGGEKKKLEMLQALVLSAKFAIFDEIDTGLDIDALKSVAAALDALRSSGTGVLVITHYQRILKYVVPDRVHVMVDGIIVESGGAELAERVEQQGYTVYTRQSH